LPAGAASLPRSSVAVCHQVTTLDKSKLSQQIGEHPAHLMQMVEEGLKAALDLE
jgi:mRNA-degrading endonuclease toxin of MazEF toxin-antitoxin module